MVEADTEGETIWIPIFFSLFKSDFWDQHFPVGFNLNQVFEISKRPSGLCVMAYYFV
jgi:hypothetical protein